MGARALRIVFYPLPRSQCAHLSASDWRRHDKNVYARIVNRFDLTREQLEEAGVLQENLYNMDEKRVSLSLIGSSTYLVSAEMHKAHSTSRCPKRKAVVRSILQIAELDT
jgi:hypothetical protein